MFVINATDYAPIDPLTPPCDLSIINIGYVGENHARCLVFDLSECVAQFGEGGFAISFIRHGDYLPYLVTDTDRLDNNAIWMINSTDTAVDGYGMVQLQYIVGTTVVKSALYQTVTFASNQIPGNVPDPYEDLLTQIAAYAAQAESAATTATAAAQTATTAVEDGIKTERSQRIAADNGLQLQITELMGLAGAPSMAATAAAMTDSNKVYVYTGNEAGYINGNWYYYNGTEWVSGGVYQATAVNTDKTLTVENMAADAKVTGDRIDECMAAFVTEQTSGSICAFDDGANNVPVKGLTVNITALQSGSGDPSPTNIRPITGFDAANIYDDSIYGGDINFNQLVKNGNFTDDSQWSGNIIVVDNVAKFTSASTSNYYAFPVYAAKFSDRNGHVIFASYDWKTDSAKSFYISLSSSINTNRIATHGAGAYTADTWYRDEIIYKPTSTADQIRAGRVGDVTEGESFSLKNVMLFDLTQMFGETVADYVYGLEQNRLGDGVAWLKSLFPDDYYTYNSGYVTTVSAVNNVPYGHYNISFGDAGTVYGGTLDVTSGMLTVTHSYFDIGAVTWSRYTTGANAVFRRNQATPPRQYGSNTDGIIGMCNAYKFYGNWSLSTLTDTMPDLNFGFQYTNSWLVVRDDSYTDVDSFKAANVGNIITFPLENPVSYQLTPTEVKTILGQNNVWADTGDVANLEYRADTRLYIEHLTSPDGDMVADANITSGSYFMVGNSLYLATANIANGGAITPGTNCTATNLAAALNAINS